MSRLVIDLSTLLQWHGPAVGITRCQQQYALYAYQNIPGTVFTVFDPSQLCLRPISHHLVESVIEGRTKLYLGMSKIPGETKVRFVDTIPQSLRMPFFWLTKFRRTLALALEERRIAAVSPIAASRWARLQERILSPKLRRVFFDDRGQRVNLPSLDQLAGQALQFGKNDVTVAIQNDWTHTAIGPILDQRDRTGSRHVVLCHDIIPIRFPEWFAPHDVVAFRRYFDLAFARADRCVFTSRNTMKDVEQHCLANGLEMPDCRIVPLGSNPFIPITQPSPLPAMLHPNRFALFVSTLEPRKNHRLLIRVWRQLIEDGTIGRSGFKLVFVGRKGWMMDELFAELEGDAMLSSTVIHLEGVDDARLNSLYEAAAFCLYPPLYEGFGLPPVEALQHGKALIASNTGPIPEIVGDFAICLDPNDEQAWTRRLRAWLTGDAEPRRLAAHTKAVFQSVTWSQSARLFFEAALSSTSRPH